VPILSLSLSLPRKKTIEDDHGKIGPFAYPWLRVPHARAARVHRMSAPHPTYPHAIRATIAVGICMHAVPESSRELGPPASPATSYEANEGRMEGVKA